MHETLQESRNVTAAGSILKFTSQEWNCCPYKAAAMPGTVRELLGNRKTKLCCHALSSGCKSHVCLFNPRFLEKTDLGFLSLFDTFSLSFCTLQCACSRSHSKAIIFLPFCVLPCYERQCPFELNTEIACSFLNFEVYMWVIVQFHTLQQGWSSCSFIFKPSSSCSSANGLSVKFNLNN